jgi:preprotein translocase subunit SecF
VTNKRGDLFPQFDFTGNWRLWFAVSGIIILIGLLSLFTRGLNVGIDFTGGSAVDLKFAERVTVAEVRDALADFGHGAAEILSSPEDPDLIILRTQTFSDEQEKEAIYEALRTRVGEFEELQSQHVMPVVSQELARNAMLAMLIAAAGILVYVSPFVAAILTIMGYSINATIVVFDRIRENLKYRKKERLGELANASISQTLMRCINTSATTLLVVLAVLLFGGRTIQSFMLALLIGVLAGTYSSIFLASPLWLMLRGEIGKMRTAKA